MTDSLTSKQIAILNSLVTYAAENVPGGLSIEESAVAAIVGRWATTGQTDITREYLDDAITRWREMRDGKQYASPETRKLSTFYIDAYQSLRMYLFGEFLPE